FAAAGFFSAVSFLAAGLRFGFSLGTSSSFCLVVFFSSAISAALLSLRARRARSGSARSLVLRASAARCYPTLPSQTESAGRTVPCVGRAKRSPVLRQSCPSCL